MELNIIIDYLIISIIASMAINNVLRNIAQHNSVLIDLPDRSRKFHKRATPLTGGISILLAILITGRIYIDFNDLIGYVPLFTYHLVLSSIMLVFSFLLDDVYKLKPLIRILIQCFLALYVIISTDVTIGTLGNLFGLGEINLGILDIPFTIFCVVGLMNAFNMIDGINGLCAGYGMLSLLLMGFYSGLIYDSMLILVIGSMIGFILFNLKIIGEKRGVFLGDHGSNLIGFYVAWSAIYVSQNTYYDVNPITMLWFVAIPFLDCVGLIYSRVTNGKNWSSPGRDHIHHKLMNRFSSEKTLLIILLASLLIGIFSIFLNNNYQEYISFILFILFTTTYYLFAYYKNKISYV
jgi:UDP-GlcNAc:undecaprenyl-phosphate/decaprenyl-phosphate GlcNAc-1-phosphate transferase